MLGYRPSSSLPDGWFPNHAVDCGVLSAHDLHPFGCRAFVDKLPAPNGVCGFDRAVPAIYLGSRFPDAGSWFLHADGSIQPGYHARYHDDKFPGASAASFAADVPYSPELQQLLLDQPGVDVLYDDSV